MQKIRKKINRKISLIIDRKRIQQRKEVGSSSFTKPVRVIFENSSEMPPKFPILGLSLSIRKVQVWRQQQGPPIGVEWRDGIELDIVERRRRKQGGEKEGRRERVEKRERGKERPFPVAKRNRSIHNMWVCIYPNKQSVKCPPVKRKRREESKSDTLQWFHSIQRSCLFRPRLRKDR